MAAAAQAAAEPDQQADADGNRDRHQWAAFDLGRNPAQRVAAQFCRLVSEARRLLTEPGGLAADIAGTAAKPVDEIAQPGQNGVA